MRRTPARVPFVFDAHLCLAEFSLHSVEDATRSFPCAGGAAHRRRAGGSNQGQALAIQRLLGEVELLSGGLEQAAEYLARAVELHEQARAPSGQALSMERMAAVALARGQRWHADRLLQRALRLAAASRLAPHLLVRVHGAMIQAAPTCHGRSPPSSAHGPWPTVTLCPPCSMSFRVAATIALARAGDPTGPGTPGGGRADRWHVGRAGHGAPPSGRRAGCSAGPKATTRRQPRCSRRPPTVRPGEPARRRGPVPSCGRRLHLTWTDILIVYLGSWRSRSDRVGSAWTLRGREQHLQAKQRLSVLPALDSLHPPISPPSGTSRPARVLFKAGMVGAGGVEPPAPSVSGHSASFARVHRRYAWHHVSSPAHEGYRTGQRGATSGRVWDRC